MTTAATAVAIASVAGLALGAPLGAQGLASTSSPSLSVAALTEAQYDAGGPSGSTQSYAITTSCTGSGSSGCRLFVQYGTNSQGQQVGMQWALTSAAPAAQCLNLPSLNVFQDVVPTTVVLTTKKNDACVATFVLRVNPLSYTTYQSPGPVSGAYRQQVKFVLTRP